MRVSVHLHADLERFAAGAERGVVRLDLPAGARVQDALRHLPLPADRQVIVGVDGAAAARDQVLSDGARLDVLPPMAGGSE
jgi:sulfur carrier protein ThiS